MSWCARRRDGRWLAVGLGLNTRSDLDSAQQQVKDLEAQISHGTEAGSAAAASYQAAYKDLEQELGTVSADLTATQQDLKAAEQAASKADQDAAAAKQQAAQATTTTEKANAQADQAKAEAQAAESRTKIATDCANAYLTAVGSLLQSQNPDEQATAAKKDLQSISDTCKTALAGT